MAMSEEEKKLWEINNPNERIGTKAGKFLRNVIAPTYIRGIKNMAGLATVGPRTLARVGEDIYKGTTGQPENPNEYNFFPFKEAPKKTPSNQNFKLSRLETSQIKTPMTAEEEERAYAESKLSPGSTLGYRPSGGKNDPGNYYSIAPNGTEVIIRSKQWDDDMASGKLAKDAIADRTKRKIALEKLSKRYGTKDVLQPTTLQQIEQPQENQRNTEYRNVYEIPIAPIHSYGDPIEKYLADIQKYQAEVNAYRAINGLTPLDQSQIGLNKTNIKDKNFTLRRKRLLAQMQDAYANANTPEEQSKIARFLQTYGMLPPEEKDPNIQILTNTDNLGNKTQSIYGPNAEGKWVNKMVDQQQVQQLPENHPALEFLRKNPSTANKFKEKYGYLPSWAVTR